MHKIQRVSLFFRVLFQITFVIMPVLLILFWINAPNPIALGAQTSGDMLINFIPKYIHVMHPLSTTEKLIGFVISLIPTSIQLLVFYFLIKLFRLYERGEIFSANNVKYLRNIGYTLLIGQLVNPIFEGLLSVALTW